MKLKKMLSLIFCAIAALSLVACGMNKAKSAENPSETDEIIFDGGDPATWGPDEGNKENEEDKENVQIPNPFQACDTLEAATELAGFDLALPKEPDRLEAIEGEMIQAFYGEEETEMLIRKAIGDQDISGDYNEYDQVETVDDVTLKGSDGNFSLATWTSDEYTYSISVSEALPQADMMELVASVK